MKRIILSLTLFMALSVSGFAQNKSDKVEDKRPDCVKELNLTADQAKQIKELQRERKEDKEVSDAKYEKGIKSILTPEQAKTWESMDKNNHRSMKKGNYGDKNKNGKHFNKSEKLDDSSREKLNTLNSDYKKKRDEIEKTVTNEDDKVKQLMELDNKYKQDIKKIKRMKKVAGKAEENSKAKSVIMISPDNA